MIRSELLNNALCSPEISVVEKVSVKALCNGNCGGNGTAHGTELRDVVGVIIHGQKHGCAVIHWDLKDNVRIRSSALETAGLKVVVKADGRHATDAKSLVLFVFIAGELVEVNVLFGVKLFRLGYVVFSFVGGVYVSPQGPGRGVKAGRGAGLDRNVLSGNTGSVRRSAQSAGGGTVHGKSRIRRYRRGIATGREHRAKTEQQCQKEFFNRNRSHSDYSALTEIFFSPLT